MTAILSFQWLPPSRPWSLLTPPAGGSESPAPALQSINAERLRENRNAVDGITATSLLSMAMGAVGALWARKARSRAFHVVSTGVHLIALGTAVAGRAAIEVHDPATLGVEDVQRGARLLRFLGAGIASDVGAMMARAVALKASRRRSETLAGTSTSLLLHGTLLLLVDTALFLRNAYQQQRCRQCVGSA